MKKNLKTFSEFINESIKKEIDPELYVVKLDETHGWREDIKEKANRIFGIYLVDKSIETHLAELKGSWYLHWLYYQVENTEDFDEDELAGIEYTSIDDPDMYVHVGSKFEEEHKVELHDSEIEDAKEDYDQFIESKLDYYRGNHIY